MLQNMDENKNLCNEAFATFSNSRLGCLDESSCSKQLHSQLNQIARFQESKHFQRGDLKQKESKKCKQHEKGGEKKYTKKKKKKKNCIAPRQQVGSQLQRRRTVQCKAWRLRRSCLEEEEGRKTKKLKKTCETLFSIKPTFPNRHPRRKYVQIYKCSQ